MRSTSTGRAFSQCRAVEGLQSPPQQLLIDAKRLKEVAISQQSIIKGDTKSASIAAASILAKVARDALERTLDMRHPGYGVADHKGYPVRAHYAALSRLGACAPHRRSFGNVRKFLASLRCRRGLGLSGRSDSLIALSIIFGCQSAVWREETGGLREPSNLAG